MAVAVAVGGWQCGSVVGEKMEGIGPVLREIRVVDGWVAVDGWQWVAVAGWQWMNFKKNPRCAIFQSFYHNTIKNASKSTIFVPK
jgi:hypothetical protein